MDWIAEHWLALLVVLAVAGIVARKVQVEKARQRRMQEWAKERRLQREREELEEQERKAKAKKDVESSLCTTPEQLELALQSKLELITIEGSLAKAYAPGAEGLARVGESYKVAVARHGKTILKRL